MSTSIEWTDETWNPVVGCTKVSQGCKHCYAKTLHDKRHKALLAGKHLHPQYAQPFEVVQLMPDRLERPLHWRKPRRVFVNSVSDLFHEDVPDAFIADVWSVMKRAPHHTFQILTKRAARMEELLRVVGEKPLPNVWLGVSVENQEAADERIPYLLATPAAIRFLSCEPLLGPVSLSGYIRKPVGWVWYPIECRHGFDRCPTCDANPQDGVDWVIVGGESGKGARPMKAMWVLALRSQVRESGVPFFFKQWGAHNRRGERVGKKRAGRLLDGREWNEYPEAVA